MAHFDFPILYGLSCLAELMYGNHVLEYQRQELFFSFRWAVVHHERSRQIMYRMKLYITLALTSYSKPQFC